MVCKSKELMISNNTKLTFIFLGVGVIVGIGVAKRYYFDESRYQFNHQLFAIGPEWVQIAAAKSIACDSYYQQLVLTILTPHQMVQGCEGCPKVKLDDGKIAEIECVLIGERGQEYPCRSVGYILGTAEPLFEEVSTSDTTKKDRRFRAVKLRSSSPLMCSSARMNCRTPPWFE